MRFFKFTTDKIVKRLRWVAVFTIFFDALNTLLGQPASFWQHPETANEVNRFAYFFMIRGWPYFCLEQLVYAAGAFLLVSILPRPISLVILFALILGHFCGASVWLVYRWQFGEPALVIYAIILAAIIVPLAFPKSRQPSNPALGG
jgi:hypothetical protein